MSKRKPSPGGPSIRPVVLIVDDDAYNRKVLRLQLESEGYSTVEAEDGQVALDLLKESRVDLVISDILMPRMDGYRLCCEMRRTKRSADLPFVLYSSTYTSPGDERLAQEVGADRYLRKPADPETIHAVVKQLLSAPRTARKSADPRAISDVTREYNERLVQKLEEKNIQLAASEERYRSMVERNPAGVIRCSLEGRVIEANSACATMFGYTYLDEFLGGRALNLFADPGTWQEIVHELREHHVYSNRELVGKKRDDSLIHVLVNFSFGNVDRGASVLEGTLLDVTELKSLHERLLHSQKLEVVARLASGVAHDFNNLLTVVIGVGELLADSFDLEDPRRRLAEEIVRTGERGGTLTRQLLAFGRRQSYLPLVVELNSVIRSLEPMLRRLIGEDVTLDFALGSHLGRIRADPSQLEQVVMNLAINARDAMPQGGRLTIATKDVAFDATGGSTSPGQRGTALVVTDTGHGIDPDTLPRIFEPFFTTKERGKGTGLGLATVHDIVERNGGKITVDSAPGRGARFEVRFMNVSEDAAAPTVSSVAPAPARNGETIVVVDDEPAIRMFVASVLRNAGYEVFEFARASDVLAEFHERGKRLDLMITDVVLQSSNGLELAETLRQSRGALPVILVSGYSDERALLDGELPPNTSFLDKPLRRDDLLRRIRSMLDGDRSRR